MLWGWDGWWLNLKQRGKKTQIVQFRVAIDVYMQSQKVNIPQGLDRCALTVGAISGTHSQVGALLRCYFTSLGFIITWSAKLKHSGKADQSTLASGGSEHA